ncbi:MAG TPA: zinc ribbon domain-containing protein [Bacillota bacterium]|nr:zinc ribbon domain-containing protein [Bacillota bacterium]
MPGYQHPCRYCDQLIPPDSNTCPLCGKVNPLGPLRCQKCRVPIQKGWKSCPGCGLTLETNCPHCGEKTFFGDYCDHCGKELKITCPKCGTKQAPLSECCLQCKKPLVIKQR